VIRFLAVGDLMVDITAEGKGHEARIALVAGGSALNAACRAANLGVDAAVAGRVGDDSGGRVLLSQLADCGVRAHVGIDPVAPTGTVLAVDGEIRADRGANAEYAPEHLPELEADAILVSGHLPEATAAAALSRARAAWVALDLARLSVPPAEAIVVFANEAAAQRITGLAPHDAVRRLAEGRRLACVTLGGAGALVAWDGQVHHATSPPTGTDNDVPGAGDAFAATLLCELARSATVPEALALACDAGAGVVRAGSTAAVFRVG